MNETIRHDILRVIDTAIQLLAERNKLDIPHLKALSNHTIHCSTIFQDEDSISMAILIHSLSKMLEQAPGKISIISVMDLLGKAKKELEKFNIHEYRSHIKKIFNMIEKVDSKLNIYVDEVINHSSLKKGTKIHEHGVSVGRACELCNTTQWELMKYLGATKTAGHETVPVRKRLAFTRSLFE